MNRTARLILFSFAAVMAMTVNAQNTTSPYSMYGYGILSDHATSTQRQMGSIGVAMNSGRQVNVMNPASYAATDSLTFLFDMGADMSMIWSKEGSAKEFAFGGGVDYLTCQFPIGKHLGGSLGLLPVTSVGYAFGNEIKHGTMENQGTGGINELYLGLAAQYFGVSLGFNIGYDFGTIANDVFSTPTGQGNSKFEHVMEIRDWNIVIGAQYTFKPARFSKMVFGLTYQPKKTFHGDTRATVQEQSQDSKPDTVASMKLKGNYYQPNSIGAGVSYTYEKASRWTVELDYKWEGWKDCKYSPLYSLDDPETMVFQGMNFNDRWRVAAGTEFIPKLRGNYGERMSYRFGAYYCNDYLKIGSNSVKEYGVSCGFGFPAPEGKTMVNLGFEWKHRQASPSQLISENYLNITLGINFNEVWFFKRKIK